MFCPHCGSAVNLAIQGPCTGCGFDLEAYQSNLAAAGVVVDPIVTPSPTPPFAEKNSPDPTQYPPSPPPSRPTNGKIILIIEDDQLISEMYKQRLVSAGYTVDVAGDGEDGLRKLQTGQYRLLLLDVMLPGMNGLNILKTMKSDHKIPDIPVIVLSNLDQGSVIDRSIVLGAIHFLVKANHTPDDILRLVDEALA